MLAARRAAAAPRAAAAAPRARAALVVVAAAQVLQGTVVSVPGARTAVVAVERLVVHPVYQKRVRDTKRFACHDLLGAGLGDVVRVTGCKPMSKTKRFAVSEIVRVADK